MNPPSPLLSVRDLTVEFDTMAGRVRAVDGVGFDVFPEESLALVGESGCGKTVTGLSILRMVPQPPGRIAAGSICFDGQELLALPERGMRAVRGRDIAMIFQEPMTALNPVFTVGAQLTGVIRRHQRLSSREARAAALALLEQVGIPEPGRRIDEYPHQLSGGQRQRVGIARALALNPALIVADEPVSALDVSVQSQVLNLVARLQREHGIAFLFISHDLAVIQHVSDEVAVMYLGRIVETGPATGLYREPQHPYTQALLSAVPVPDPTRRRQRIVLAGEVPSPANPPSGCAFHPRCPRVRERCRHERPELAPAAGAPTAVHVACHFPGPAGN
ncbi:MAG: ABC transporter ATP-binding protein [Gammaproteobacteria bacterium]|nr:MAG: ABC transporter ATP-binding protein [Gammaproteobacteria bacterium]